MKFDYECLSVCFVLSVLHLQLQSCSVSEWWVSAACDCENSVLSIEFQFRLDLELKLD